MTELAHWQKTIIEYLSPGKLAPAAAEDHLQNRYFKRSIDELMAKEPAQLDSWAPLPGHEGVEFAIGGHHDALLRESSTGKVIGGYVWVLPYLDPDFRGRGIMASLHKQVDDAGLRFTTQNYTISGLMARTHAHALHVADALGRGEDVPEHVLEDYDVADGHARLREPMTRERYVAECLTHRELEKRLEERVAELSADSPEPAGM